jgi:hypothetical protein
VHEEEKRREEKKNQTVLKLHMPSKRTMKKKKGKNSLASASIVFTIGWIKKKNMLVFTGRLPLYSPI